MKKINKFIIFLSVLSMLGTAVQAAPAVITTKDAITITNRYSTGEGGQLYSVDIYDDTYTSENPYSSLVYRNQGITGNDGWWNMTIPMSGEEYGVYRVASGETTGVYSAFGALYDGFDGEKTYSNVDVQSDESMKLEASSYIETDFPELISNKRVNISFDIELEPESQVFLRLNNCKNAVWNDKTQIFDTLLFRADGKFGLFTKNNNGTLAPELFSYEYKKAYHIELDINMLKHSLDCYINNDFFGTMSFNEGLANLGGFRISCSQGSATLANLESTVSELEASERLKVDVKSKAKAGNIYFDESDVSFDVSALYAGLSDAKYNVHYEIYNEENGVLIGEETEEIFFVANQKKEFVKTFDFNEFDMKYGLFELKLVFEDVDSDIRYETDRCRFSVVKEAKEANSKLGIHTQFGHGYANPEINTYLMNKSGFSGIRDYLAYTQCFKNGTWSEPSRYNNWVDDVLNNNLSQIIQFPTEDVGFPKTDAEIEEYVKYTVAVVENLTKDGVYMYELGNELNWSCTAAEYAELLIKVAPAIHNVDENVKILAFAVAGVNNFHSVNWMINVIDIIKAKGLDPHDYIDYITVHPYRALNQYPEKAERTCGCTYGTESYPELTWWEQYQGKKHPDPKDTIKGDSSLVARMDNLNARLKAVDCDDIPIIATEIGWYSYEGASTQTDCEECVAKEVTSLTEIGQAQYTLRATALLYNKLDKIYYHTLNNKRNSAGTMERNFGFTENWSASETEIPYEAKPVFVAMSNFNAMLSGAELVQENVSGKNYDYVFSKDGKIIHMLWTTNTAGEYTLNTSSNVVKMYDMYGNEKSLSSEGGYYKLTLSASPVYVEELSDYSELKITETENGAKAELISGAGFNGKCYIFCASYKDGRLLNVTMNQLENWSGGKIETDSISISDADTVRAFLWDSNLKPILKYEISK